MRIVEKFIEGKNKNQDLCEDGIFVSENFIAIIDGATSQSKALYDGKSSGRIAMEKIKLAMDNVPHDANVEKAVDIISKYISDWYKSIGKYEHLKENSVERPTASVIIYSRFKKEIWCIGDCHFLLDEIYINNDKLIDKITSEARELFLKAEILSGKTIEDLCKNDSGRNFILPLLERQNIFQNRSEHSEYNYGVIDGFPVPKNLIKLIDASEAKSIVLASDGYPKLFKTLEETETYLKQILKEDPLCFISNKSTKALTPGSNSFDDRTFISFKIDSDQNGSFRRK